MWKLDKYRGSTKSVAMLGLLAGLLLASFSQAQAQSRRAVVAPADSEIPQVTIQVGRFVHKDVGQEAADDVCSELNLSGCWVKPFALIETARLEAW